MKIFTSIALSALIAAPAMAATFVPPTPDLSRMVARRSSTAGFKSTRHTSINGLNEKMFRGMDMRRAGAVEAPVYSPAVLGPSSSWGDLDGPDGKVWFYTIDIESDAIEHEYYTEYVSRHWTLNIFDEKMQPVATLQDDVHYTEGEKRTVLLEPLPILTNHYFNQDDKWEVAMSFGINFTPGHNHYRTLIYQIDGEKNEAGNDVSIYELDELISDVVRATGANGEEEYYMTLLHDHAYVPEEFDWEGISDSDKFWEAYTHQNVVFDVYKKTGAMESPQHILSKPIFYANFPGTQENSPVLSLTENGKAYMVFSYYKEPLFNPFYSWTEDFSQREENSLMIDVYELDEEATLLQTTEIPFAKNDEDLLAKYYSIGDLRYTKDVNFSDFNTNGKAAFYVTESRQKRGTESPDYFVYYVYNPDGSQRSKVFEGAENTLSVADLDGFEPQQLFVTYEYGEYIFNFVDLISCKKVASFSHLVEIDEDSDPDAMTANIDRVKIGKTYNYVSEMRMPIDVDDYTWMRILWLDKKGNFDHIDYVNLGPNVHYAMSYLDETVLKPNLYHSDDNMEYMMLVKRGVWNDELEAEEKIIEELLVAQAISEDYPDGRDILRLGENEFGPISNILPYTLAETPMLAVSYFNNNTNKYYCETYTLPLDVVTGVELPSITNDRVVYDGVNLAAAGHISVYNLQGIRVAAGNNHLDIRSLPAGIYIVKTDSGTTKIFK